MSWGSCKSQSHARCTIHATARLGGAVLPSGLGSLGNLVQLSGRDPIGSMDSLELRRGRRLAALAQIGWPLSCTVVIWPNIGAALSARLADELRFDIRQP